LQNAEEVELRKSYRIRRSTILSDYVVYLQESDVDVGHKDDPKLFSVGCLGKTRVLMINFAATNRPSSLALSATTCKQVAVSPEVTMGSCKTRFLHTERDIIIS